jgi:hypothetical protein
MNDDNPSGPGKSASATGIGLTIPHSMWRGADQGIP